MSRRSDDEDTEVREYRGELWNVDVDDNAQNRADTVVAIDDETTGGEGDNASLLGPSHLDGVDRSVLSGGSVTRAGAGGQTVWGLVKRWVLPIFAVLAFAVVIASESRRIWHANALYRLPLLSGPLPASRHALTGKLSNGLRYTLVPGNIDPPGRVTSYLHVNAGSLDEDDDQRGMAHFIEHMTFDNSMQFPGRGGGWDHICKTGVAGFNAFTTFRSTTFQLYNFNSSRLDDLFKVHEAQVSGMVPRDEYVRAEAGAILGEARFRNGTTRILSNLVLENHGGSTWRIPHRFTIGVPTQIETFTGSDLARFYSKWYRPDRFHLILAGDFEAKDAEEALARTLGKISTTLAQVEAAGGKDRRDPPPHPAATLPTPRKRLYLTHLPPHREISVHLLITMPPPAPPPFGAPERRRALFSRVFVSLLTLMSHVRMAELYPDLALNALGGRRVSFAIRPYSYELGVGTIGCVAETGSTWRREIGVIGAELMRVATHGGGGVVGGLLRREVGKVRAAPKHQWRTSRSIAKAVYGSGDPREIYSDAGDPIYHDGGGVPEQLVRAAEMHVQSMAQYLFKALVRCAESLHHAHHTAATHNGTAATDGAEHAAKVVDHGPFVEVRDPIGDAASLAVIVGGKGPKTRNVDAVTSTDVAKVILEVRDAAPPPALDLDAFMVTLSHGVHADGIDIPGTEPPVGVPKRGTLYDRRRMFARMSTHAVMTASNRDSGVSTFVLGNGVRVNLKPRMSGTLLHPRSKPGKVMLHVVSLGGHATEPAAIPNACKLVNMGVAAGYSAEYYDNMGEFDTADYDVSTVKAYFDGAQPARLICEEEFFVIEKELHGPCRDADSDRNGVDVDSDPGGNPPYPARATPDATAQPGTGPVTAEDEDEPEGCDPTEHNYFKKLEGVRLAMAPMYDARSIEIATARLRSDLQDLDDSGGPEEIMRYHGIEPAMQAFFPNDTRFARPSPDLIAQVDPLLAQAWVREQWAPERLEVNVVGDFDPSHLLLQLNMILGTLPGTNLSAVGNFTGAASAEAHAGAEYARLRRTMRVGRDVYAKTAASLADFRGRAMPASGAAAKTVSCTAASPTAHRAFVTSMLPAADFRTVHMARFAADPLWKEHVYNQLRRIGGYAYFITTRAFHSILFKDFGHYSVTWAPGAWPAGDKGAKGGVDATVTENIAKSTAVVAAAGKGPIPREIYDINMPQVAGKLDVGAHALGDWLIIMRGVSLRAPASWNLPDPDATIKSINDTDLYAYVTGPEASYDKIKEVLTPYTSKGPFLNVDVTAVRGIEVGTCNAL